MQIKHNATRILALDIGRKRIGVAISDPQKIIASSLDNIVASPKIETTIEKLAQFLNNLMKEKKCEIEKIIVGLPLNMSGSDSETTTYVRHFVALLQAAITIPVQLFDERLTTVQAERALMDVGFTRRRRSELVDGASAVILLQSYLGAA